MVTLVGDPTLVQSQISLKAMLRALRKNGQGYWVECNRMEVNKKRGLVQNSGDGSVPNFLKEVIETYSRVFDTPTGLPRKRNHEHAINKILHAIFF